MRNQVRAVLRRRLPPAPPEFVALQVSRLNEAMNISFNAMYNPQTGANFQAIGQVVRIVRALAAITGSPVCSESARLRQLLQPRRVRTRRPRPSSRESIMAQQAIENVRFGPGVPPLSHRHAPPGARDDEEGRPGSRREIENGAASD